MSQCKSITTSDMNPKSWPSKNRGMDAEQPCLWLLRLAGKVLQPIALNMTSNVGQNVYNGTVEGRGTDKLVDGLQIG